MEPKRLGPDADHSPAIEYDDEDCDCVEHSLGTKFVVSLNKPENVNTNCLECNPDNQ